MRGATPPSAVTSPALVPGGLDPGTGRGRIWLLPGPDPAYVSSSSRFGGDVVLLVYWLDRIPGASCGFFVTCSTHAAEAGAIQAAASAGVPKAPSHDFPAGKKFTIH